ncbi:hypothetical protein ACQBAT_03875 [Ornithinimicrobium sp. Y1847]|uniref:hypothetical protein n=1 Tax=unclassified Ornithinimicrobium TaxID=2615080 RepID=UPI003B6797A5
MATGWRSGPSELVALLPGAEFGEFHHGVIDAGPEEVWRALHLVRWSDLRLSKPLLLARGFGAGPGMDRGVLATFEPLGVTVGQPPTRTFVAMVGRPWSPVPGSRTVSTPEEVADFAEPGWLRYGMEWHLVPLPGDRTLVETWTVCAPTDATARRRFRAYWTVVRPGSGLIRREIIGAVRRACAAT